MDLLVRSVRQNSFAKLPWWKMSSKLPWSKMPSKLPSCMQQYIRTYVLLHACIGSLDKVVQKLCSVSNYVLCSFSRIDLTSTMFPKRCMVFSFWISLPQAKGWREKERETKRKGKEKGKGKIGSEALAETENISYAPAWKRTRNPSKRSWSSIIEPPPQATS